MRHPADHKLLVEEASKKPKSVYIPLNKNIEVHGIEMTLISGIKSLDLPCLQEVKSHGVHPFTCSNSAKQDRELKNTP